MSAYLSSSALMLPRVGYCGAGDTDLNGAMVAGGWTLSCPRLSTRYVGMEPNTGAVLLNHEPCLWLAIAFFPTSPCVGLVCIVDDDSTIINALEAYANAVEAGASHAAALEAACAVVRRQKADLGADEIRAALAHALILRSRRKR
jgi:hypothetical protein